MLQKYYFLGKLIDREIGKRFVIVSNFKQQNHKISCTNLLNFCWQQIYRFTIERMAFFGIYLLVFKKSNKACFAN